MERWIDPHRWVFSAIVGARCLPGSRPFRRHCHPSWQEAGIRAMPPPGHPGIPHPGSRLSVVLNKTRVLGIVEGVTVIAVRIDYTDRRVWFHARAVPNNMTEQLKTEFWSARQRWRVKQQAQGWIAPEEPPCSPGQIMTRLAVRLTSHPHMEFDPQISAGDQGPNGKSTGLGQTCRQLHGISRPVARGKGQRTETSASTLHLTTEL
jgi:hypothetical protein